MASEEATVLPVTTIDLTKRYDIYHCIRNEERLYENVKLVGLRDIPDKPSFGGFGRFLEIEFIFGSRILISSGGVHMICEHGTKPLFKVFRSWVQSSEPLSE